MLRPEVQLQKYCAHQILQGTNWVTVTGRTTGKKRRIRDTEIGDARKGTGPGIDPAPFNTRLDALSPLRRGVRDESLRRATPTVPVTPAEERCAAACGGFTPQALRVCEWCVLSSVQCLHVCALCACLVWVCV